ncbi:hypothetical protein EPA93_16785 [Ktedonosporobacter rubrisoli]|uniref:ABC transmembrane type-1 domain-containing protein n=1 Tax=Ktedonosporobacter rubrisoli TaxID=2509675 RepID=A0A4P6JRV3_KTERU|nr:hypothetical protein [Ktedonosporobacter rubrisoli]QBD77556.1 hypothetical protein EPA93_16785 [Ktedonosporobacter rubrisoli]
MQERLGNRVQSMILHKVETLDLTFFENADFYDELRNASDESIYKPMQMISQVFDVLKTVMTLFSRLALLLSLAWWLAMSALLMPIPSFLSSSRYGWHSYQKMCRQSPQRRRLHYLVRLMTTDTYNKEIKLFNLGPFFSTSMTRWPRSCINRTGKLWCRVPWSVLAGAASLPWPMQPSPST